MCDKAHRYTVEVIGETPRYVGTDKAAAVAALVGLIDDGEGYAVAEHDLGNSTSYCRIESQLVEIAALRASLEAIRAKIAKLTEMLAAEQDAAADARQERCAQMLAVATSLDARAAAQRARAGAAKSGFKPVSTQAGA